MEADPTAVEPDESPEPPEGYIPQVELTPGQAPGITERDSDLIEDAEAEVPKLQLERDGAADEDDD